MSLSADQLLAGAELTFEVEIPPNVLRPGEAGLGPDGRQTVTLRPLRISDLQVIGRAAADQDHLFATLMVQRSLVDPPMTVAQVAALHAGLVQFLVGEVNRISGLDGAADAVAEALAAPLTQAAFLLAREFGWTPAQINELTLGQVLLHLELLHRQAEQ